MKRFLKSLLVAVAVIPLAFTLVACGGDQLSSKADVDTKGKYQEVTIEDMETYAIQSAKTSDEFNKGARLTLDVSYDGSKLSDLFGGLISSDSTATKTTATMQINAIVRWTITDNKATLNELAYRSSATLNEKEMVADYYIKDSMEYVNASYGDSKVQYKKAVKMDALDSGSISTIESAGTQVNFAEVIGEIKANYVGKSNYAVVLEKATSGKYTKWHLAVKTTNNGEETVVLESYYVYKSNNLVGYTSMVNMGAMKVSCAVEAFDGTVKLPKGAEDYSTTVPTDAKWLTGIESIFG